jgi:putative redox protein
MNSLFGCEKHVFTTGKVQLGEEGRMDAKVTWKHNLSFTGTANSGFSIPLGSGGQPGVSEGTSPMELLGISLAGCTGMDVIDILRKKRQDVTGFEVRVHGDRADEHPRVFTHMTVEYTVTGHHVDLAAVERAVDLSVTKYCSVLAMLNKVAEIEHKITILEDTSVSNA